MRDNLKCGRTITGRSIPTYQGLSPLNARATRSRNGRAPKDRRWQQRAASLHAPEGWRQSMIRLYILKACTPAPTPLGIAWLFPCAQRRGQEAQLFYNRRLKRFPSHRLQERWGDTPRPIRTHRCHLRRVQMARATMGPLGPSWPSNEVSENDRLPKRFLSETPSTRGSTHPSLPPAQERAKERVCVNLLCIDSTNG